MEEKDETLGAGDWGRENTHAFLDCGRYFVPDRDEQTAIICRLVPRGPGSISILELCCGEGLLAAALLERLHGCSVRGLDGSPEMLDHARRALAKEVASSGISRLLRRRDPALTARRATPDTPSIQRT